MKRLLITFLITGSFSVNAMESVSVAGYVTGADGKPRTIITNIPMERVVVMPGPGANLHLAEKLSYSTTVLEVAKRAGEERGTGFFYAFTNRKYTRGRVPVIITNKHVVEGARSISFYMRTLTQEGKIGEVVRSTLAMPHLAIVPHPSPSVDLCAILIGPEIDRRHRAGVELFGFEYTKEMIPSSDYLKDVTQLDDVVMIGYPGGLRDCVNNQPIFRRGVLATNPNLDFNGRKWFLIDMPVYGGSSGSPILLYAEGYHYNRRGGPSMQLGNVVKLLGVNAATYLSEAEGKIVPVPIPTVAVEASPTNSLVRFAPVPVTKIPNNVGIIVKASCINEIENLFWTAFAEVEKRKGDIP